MKFFKLQVLPLTLVSLMLFSSVGNIFAQDEKQAEISPDYYDTPSSQ